MEIIKKSSMMNKNKILSGGFSLFVFVGIIVVWGINYFNGINIFETLLVYSDDAKKGINITFTSLNFIFVFLPLSVLLYYLMRAKFRDVFLVVASIVFYALGEPVMVWLLLLSVFLNYVFGLLLSKKWNYRWIKTLILILMLTWNLGLLFYYKYYVFTLENISLITGKNIIIPNIAQPLGISFFTFRTISFCMDVYWETVPVQYNFINVALYICFFPQVIMGPISKYNDFSIQIKNRVFDIDLFLDGIKRIIIGFAKKLIISNNIGKIVDAIFFMNGSERTILLSWLGILSYLIQLYYDFSGYSDVAVGVGQLFGFRTPENFNYPYISKSAAEFWSRWHITLGTWLKNYIYTPVFRAFQNKGMSIAMCNIMGLLFVWLFAGIWHGAGWNFFFYGVYFFVLIALERVVEDYNKKRRKRLKIKKKPETLGDNVRAHIYFFFVVVFGMLFIRCSSLKDVGDYFKSLFGLNNNLFYNSTTYYYWHQTMALFFVGIFFAFPVIKYVKTKLSTNTVFEWAITIVTPIIYAALLIVSVAYAMTDTYQSFIYFQF